jgi:flagellar protein FlaG
MSIAIAPAEGRARQEFSPKSGAIRIAQVHGAEIKVAAFLPEKDKPDEKPLEIAQTAAELEQISMAFDKKLKFVVDHQSHEVIVKVIDSATDKVIKILPPEELQRTHRRIRETIGFLFDEKV